MFVELFAFAVHWDLTWFVCLYGLILSTSDGRAKEGYSLYVQTASEQMFSLLSYLSCGCEFVQLLFITFIRSSFNPRNVTLKAAVNIKHLHLTTWHFCKIGELSQKLRLTCICLIFLIFFFQFLWGKGSKKSTVPA